MVLAKSMDMMVHHDRLATCYDRAIPFWLQRPHELLETEGPALEDPLVA